MISKAFIFVCGAAAGVLTYDAAIERQAKQMSGAEPYAAPVKFSHPIQCDATVNGKCYIRGMR